MYKDHMALIHELRDYSSPKARITRMIKSGDVIQVRRGIFLDGHDKDYSLKSLASVIYGPSYLSFEYALSHYGLIPERATIVTSAVYNKNKNRRFTTPLGGFYYYYVPAGVYPYGITREEENNQSYLIATREKALLDTLYKTRGINSMKSLTDLLFEDMRVERHDLAAFDRESVNFIAPLYGRKACSLFMRWLEKEGHHA